MSGAIVHLPPRLPESQRGSRNKLRSSDQLGERESGTAGLNPPRCRDDPASRWYAPNRFTVTQGALARLGGRRGGLHHLLWIPLQPVFWQVLLLARSEREVTARNLETLLAP